MESVLILDKFLQIQHQHNALKLGWKNGMMPFKYLPQQPELYLKNE